MKSTSGMPFLVTSPISIMKPIAENMLSVEPAASSASATPINAIGSDIMIATGWTTRRTARMLRPRGFEARLRNFLPALGALQRIFRDDVGSTRASTGPSPPWSSPRPPPAAGRLGELELRGFLLLRRRRFFAAEYRG